jgi:hypothetical protein
VVCADVNGDGKPDLVANYGLGPTRPAYHQPTFNENIPRIKTGAFDAVA